MSVLQTDRVECNPLARYQMGWAIHYIAKLKAGETVSFRPRGNSMQGRIESGQLVTVIPITESTQLSPGNIVLCKVSGNEYLHLIDSITSDGSRFTIANNKGHINGTIDRRNIYGLCIKVEK